MNDLLKQLMAGLKGTSAGTRAIVVLFGAAVVAIVGLAAVVTNRPHYELAFSGLTDRELAQVCKALSDAGIAFEQSQPPGPFVVYVDAGDRSSAYMAAYGAGALDKPLEGILADGGMASVFNSSEERAQGVRKREWQEMEKMLEELDFVVSARVRTAAGSSGAFGTAPAVPATASVTLHVAGDAELSAAQAATVANLVSRGLGIEKRSLMISDQSGKPLYDGEDQSGDGREVKDLLAHQGEYDRRLAGEANTVLAGILGPNKARVSVSSRWDYAQSTLRRETSQKGPVVHETKTTSEKPVASSHADQIAGLSANTLDPDAPAALPAGTAAAAEPLLEKTSEEEKDYTPSVEREERVRILPELERLSVALFLDQSVQEPQKLEAAVKAAVGFEEGRDEFSSVVLPFAVAPVVERTTGEEPVAETPSPIVGILVERGVEILCAAAFLLLLVKSLRGARQGAQAATVAAAADERIDPELLARAQVDELLKTDPARVGEILSRWVREEPAGTRT